ncbi:MAG: hypothetical protein EZS28_053316, partial [Streblomastix strix]
MKILVDLMQVVNEKKKKMKDVEVKQNQVEINSDQIILLDLVELAIMDYLRQSLVYYLEVSLMGVLLDDLVKKEAYEYQDLAKIWALAKKLPIQNESDHLMPSKILPEDQALKIYLISLKSVI